MTLRPSCRGKRVFTPPFFCVLLLRHPNGERERGDGTEGDGCSDAMAADKRSKQENGLFSSLMKSKSWKEALAAGSSDFEDRGRSSR